jgi:hypothetical protein
VACAAMIYTGLRPGEIMALQVRDQDADGTILWVEKSKTEAGKRGVDVAEVFRPFLRSLAQGRNSQDYLFEFKPERSRVCADERKRRSDALLRRTRSLCKSAGLPVVCSHSMRGLHSTLAAGFGATGHAVAKALGHTSFNVTKRHHVDREVLANASLRSNLEVLQCGTPGVRGVEADQGRGLLRRSRRAGEARGGADEEPHPHRSRRRRRPAVGLRGSPAAAGSSSGQARHLVPERHDLLLMKAVRAARHDVQVLQQCTRPSHSSSTCSSTGANARWDRLPSIRGFWSCSSPTSSRCSSVRQLR